jgi:hypothetical protein
MTTPYSSGRKNSTLEDILNINIDKNTLSHNSVISYNNNTNLWENGAESGSSNILEVSDSNEYLDYNFVFTDGAGTGKTLNVDSITAPCTINPSNGNLSIVDTLKIGQLSVAIGKLSGTTQKSFCISLGAFAGQNQETDAIAIGRNSGQILQGQDSIAIGRQAGSSEQGTCAISIGQGSGRSSQGENSIAVGAKAGYNYQVANSIILNAMAIDLDANFSGFYVKPVRSIADASESERLYYNTITGEICSETKQIRVEETDPYEDLLSATAGIVSASRAIIVDTKSSVSGLTDLGITGKITGPSIFVIDPAAIGDNTGTVVIKGSLQVDGSSTIINSSTLDISDHRILLSSNSTNQTQTYGAGIEISGNKTFTYQAGDIWESNIDISATNIITNNLNLAGVMNLSNGLYVNTIRNETDVSLYKSLYYDTGTGEIVSGATPSGGGASSTTYTIGYNAELGGYVIKLSADMKHGIVCAANDWLSFGTWYSCKTRVSDWNTSVMTTDELNFFDWVIPTQTELNVIHSFKSELGINPNWYWTSTDAWGTNKIIIGQMSGASFYTQSYDKNSPVAKTRAVRRF